MSVEADVLTRDAGRCVRDGIVVLSGPRSCHHRKLKGQGGPDGPANRITLCGSGTTGCHGWVHAHPRLAREAGWMVSAHSDPAAMLVWVYDTGWCQLTDDFDVIPVPGVPGDPPLGAVDVT